MHSVLYGTPVSKAELGCATRFIAVSGSVWGQALNAFDPVFLFGV